MFRITKVVGIVCLMLSVLFVTSVVADDNADTEVKEWEPNIAVGRLVGVDLNGGNLLDDKGNCLAADIFAPFNLPIVNRKANTKLVGQLRENEDGNRDIMFGGAISVEGVNFFKKDVGQVEISAGVEPVLLTNLSYGYRSLVNKDDEDEFDLGKFAEIDAMFFVKALF